MAKDQSKTIRFGITQLELIENRAQLERISVAQYVREAAHMRALFELVTEDQSSHDALRIIRAAVRASLGPDIEELIMDRD